MSTTVEFIRCRTLGHAWETVGSASDEQTGEFAQRHRCIFCTSERWEYVLPDGSIKSRKYKHAVGYLRAKGATDDKPTKAEWRLQFLHVAMLANRSKRVKS